MTINIAANSLVSALNNMDPNSMADRFRAMKLGNVVRQQLPANLWGKALDGAAGTNPYVVAAAQSITLPDDAKAQAIMSIVARTGTGTTGVQLVNDVMAATEPAAGHCKVSPTGDLLFQHVDAWTSLDITYFPDVYDIYELFLPVASNALVLPTGLYGSLLMEAEALAGTSVGKKIVQTHSTAPSAGQAAFNAAGTQVLFNSGDAVTNARVKIGVKPAVDLHALLETTSNLFV